MSEGGCAGMHRVLERVYGPYGNPSVSLLNIFKKCTQVSNVTDHDLIIWLLF